MQRFKGLTLVELMIAVALIGILVVTMGAVGKFVSNARAELQEDFLPIAQANLIVETIYQRLLRAPIIKRPGGTTLPFEIFDGGTRLRYEAPVPGGSRTEEIGMDGDTLVYDPDISDAIPGEVILRGLESIRFVRDFGDRLAIELSLKGDAGAVRSSVRSRNQFTARSVIN